jgi:tetratricopeptide (TPR) repeat protein
MKRACLTAGLALLVALVSVEARAQTGILRGRVLDDQGKPIEDAKIEMDYQGGVNRKNETKTNKKGEYTQVGLPPGNYKITASKDGYQPGTIELRVGIGEPTTPPDFKLVLLSRAPKAAGGGGGPDLLATGFNEVLALAKAGKNDEAETKVKDLIAKNPTVPELQRVLGYVLAQKKDWAGAEEAYKKALEMRSDYSEATMGLVDVYRASGRPADAEALLGKAAAASPQDAKVQFQVGVAAFSSGKSPEAIAAFEKALELDPSSAESHYYLGSLMVGQNKIPEAVAHLEKYLATNPPAGQNKATAEGLLAALKPKK